MPDDRDPDALVNIRFELDKNTEDLDKAIKDIESLKRENAELRELIKTLTGAVEIMPDFLQYLPAMMGSSQQKRGEFGKVIQDLKAKTKPR